MKLSDYVVQFLVDHGIHDIFLVSGGGIMHLLDSVGRNPSMHYYCNHHEQACAISAEAYARSTNHVGACLVTTGPGGANALSGVAGAWVDSIPVLVISGQVRTDLMADYSKLRSFGPQEGNIVAMARSVTKYARTIRDPKTIRQELELALITATSGRPGPVWLDIPLDVQGSRIDEAGLVPHGPLLASTNGEQRVRGLSRDVSLVVEALQAARRPIFVAGNGIHLSGSEDLLLRLLEQLPVPVVVSHAAKDLVPEDHPRYAGVFGPAGQRRANFAVQCSDCLISLAGGLCVSKTGFDYRGFASRARKIIVDIDEGQLLHQAIKPDLAIQADIRAFLAELLHQTTGIALRPRTRWLDAIAAWRQRFPLILDDYDGDREHVNSYVFMDKLSDLLAPSDVVVAGAGVEAASYWQAFKVKRGQRTMINGNWGAMGWDLPAAVGACVGSGRRRTICVTGDGSIQMNVQELQTIRHYSLPIKTFVFNNRGYTCIRTTQNSLFDGRFVGADPESGVDNPDFALIARAYGLDYQHILNNGEMIGKVRQFLSTPGPSLCEVNLSEQQGITPKASTFKHPDGTLESRPLEDMSPFLPREELSDNLRISDD